MKRKNIKNYIYFILIILVVFNFWLWYQVLSGQALKEPAVYFLDVGQGDSQLIVLPSARGGSVKILIDGGRDYKVLRELDAAFGGFTNKYIDLVISTHEDADHLGGLIGVLERYQIGAFISNGRGGVSPLFINLKRLLRKFQIPTLVLTAGDKITYRGNQLLVLSPSAKFLREGNKNDASLVILLHVGGDDVLFTADIGFKTENWLLRRYGDLRVKVLKVAHHGSKYSSSLRFIRTVSPLISVIGVGKNHYGHPTRQVLDILEGVGSTVYRTDLDGTVKIILD